VSRHRKPAEAPLVPHHVAVRLDAEILSRVDALGPVYSQPWRKATRSDLLRLLVLAGLDVEEKKLARQKRGRR
jgi:hypothetical protein